MFRIKTRIIATIFFFLLASGCFAGMTNDFDFNFIGYRNIEDTVFNYSERDGTAVSMVADNGSNPLKEFYKNLTFTNSTNNINTGSNWVADKTGTFYLVIKINSNGGGSFAQIVTNGVCQIRINSSGGTKIGFSNNSSVTEAQTSVLAFGKIYVITILRKANNTASIYLDGVINKENGACGTLATGIANVLLGNNTNYNRAFDGYIYEVKFTENLHSETQIRHNANELTKMYKAGN